MLAWEQKGLCLRTTLENDADANDAEALAREHDAEKYSSKGQLGSGTAVVIS